MSGVATFNDVFPQKRLSALNWSAIAEDVGRAFRLTSEEVRKLKRKPVAKVLAAIPFAAGADDPERTAVRNLGAYLLSVSKTTKPYFFHVPTDDADILRRLYPFTEARGGDETILDRARCLLAYHMIRDYEKDRQEDAELGKYNPISAGAFDPEPVKRRLLERSGLTEGQVLSTLSGAETEDWWLGSPQSEAGDGLHSFGGTETEDWWLGSPETEPQGGHYASNGAETEDWWLG